MRARLSWAAGGDKKSSGRMIGIGCILRLNRQK
jgi:hypothetical protein